MALGVKRSNTSGVYFQSGDQLSEIALFAGTSYLVAALQCLVDKHTAATWAGIAAFGAA